MAATDVRPKITLACQECKNRSYITRKNRRNDPDRISLAKFCNHCRRHTEHRETRLVAVPLDPAVVGRAYPAPEAYEVSREKIRDFALALGDPNPLYLDPAAARAVGHPDVLAPPTFLTVLGFRFAASGPLADPALGLDYSRVVHGEQRFEAHRPVVAGDRLLATSSVEKVRAAAGNDLLTVRTDVTDEAGAPVATLTSTIVSRGDGRLMLAAGEVAVGDEIGPLTVPVTRATLVAYAGASGDYNVIHWNQRIAQAVGLPDVIAHGMLTMGVAGRLVTDWAGDPAAVRSYAVRFTRPLVVPDDDRGAELVATGRVEAVDTEAGTATVVLTVTAAGAGVLSGARAVVQLR